MFSEYEQQAYETRTFQVENWSKEKWATISKQLFIDEAKLSACLNHYELHLMNCILFSSTTDASHSVISNSYNSYILH